MFKKIVVIGTVFFVCGCKKINTSETNYTYELSRLKNSYLNTRFFLLTDLQNEMKKLEQSLRNFTVTQQITFYSLSKVNWANTYSTYLKMGPFYQDNSSFTHIFSQNRKRISLSSINPSYIDYTLANPTSGIINDSAGYPKLFSSDLLNFHQIGSESNISIGFHAIEFLLWGEDTNPTGPGLRLSQEFAGSTTANTRRRNYLSGLNDRLRLDLEMIINETDFSDKLLKLNAIESADALFTPLIKQVNYLAESLIKKPLDSQNEKYELDRFSDQTVKHLKDILFGIEIYMNPRPLFTLDSDYFMIDFFEEVSEGAKPKIIGLLEKANTELNSVSISFDQAILSAQQRNYLSNLYSALKTLEDELIAIRSKVMKN